MNDLCTHISVRHLWGVGIDVLLATLLHGFLHKFIFFRCNEINWLNVRSNTEKSPSATDQYKKWQNNNSKQIKIHIAMYMQIQP